MLRNVDGFNYLDNAEYHVDGYGTHLYPSPNDIEHSLTSTLREDEAALGRDKPFWVTEWGFLNLKAFPNRRGETLGQGVEEFLAIFERLKPTIPLGPVMYYAYSEDPEKWSAQAAAFTAYTAKR